MEKYKKTENIIKNKQFVNAILKKIENYCNAAVIKM